MCKISRVRSVTEFGMGQGGRGGPIHERAATLPSPAPGLETGDVESFGVGVLYMGQVKDMLYRAKYRSQKVQPRMMSRMGCLTGGGVQYGYPGHAPGLRYSSVKCF